MASSEVSRHTYLWKVFHLVREFAADPIMVGRAVPGEFRQWYRWYERDRFPHYEADQAWYEHRDRGAGREHLS